MKLKFFTSWHITCYEGDLQKEESETDTNRIQSETQQTTRCTLQGLLIKIFKERDLLEEQQLKEQEKKGRTETA